MARYQVLDQQGLNFITLTVVEWIDVFTRKEYKNLIVESLEHCKRKKGLVIFAYVIMSNHLHLIVQASGKSHLSDILRDFKRYTANRIIEDLEQNPLESRREWMLWHFRNHGRRNSNNKKYQFWQRGNHPFLLFSPKVIRQKLAYIHANPVVQGWVVKPEDYWYSSALYYLEGRGPLEIDILDLGVTEGYFMPKFK
jgi:putative transposase